MASTSPVRSPRRGVEAPTTPRGRAAAEGLVRSPTRRPMSPTITAAAGTSTTTTTIPRRYDYQLTVPTSANYHPADILFELPDVLVQAFPISTSTGSGGNGGGVGGHNDGWFSTMINGGIGPTQLPHFSATPQVSPLVIASAVHGGVFGRAGGRNGGDNDNDDGYVSTPVIVGNHSFANAAAGASDTYGNSASAASPAAPSAAATKGLLLLANYKIPLDNASLIVQLSRFVYDFHVDVVVTRKLSAVASAVNRIGSSGSSPLRRATSPLSRQQQGAGSALPTSSISSPATPTSPDFSSFVATICVRVALPNQITKDDADALPSILECFAPLRRVNGAQRSVERESLLGGGISLASYRGVVGAFATNSTALVPISGAGVVSDDGNLALVSEHQQQQQQPALSTTIATSVSYYGRLAAGYINSSTSYAVNSMGRGADMVVATTVGCETPVTVPSVVMSGIEGSRAVAQTAASVTGGVASALLGAAGYVGSYAGGAVARAFVGDGSDASPSTQISSYISESAILTPVAEVGSAVIGTGALVFSTVCDAQQSVMEAARNNVTKVVTHKLGPEVGHAAHGVMETARLSVEVACVASSKRVKRTAVLMAAKVAKQAADSAVDGRRRLEQEQLTMALRPGGGGGGVGTVQTIEAAPYTPTNSTVVATTADNSPNTSVSTPRAKLQQQPSDASSSITAEVTMPTAGQKSQAAADAVARHSEGRGGERAAATPLEIEKEETDDTSGGGRDIPANSNNASVESLEASGVIGTPTTAGGSLSSRL